MGLYDRDYVRRAPSGFLGGDRSMVTNLILLNVGIFLLDMFFQGQISHALRLQPGLLSHPWRFWQLLTYGFVHDPGNTQEIVLGNFAHVGFNMFGLWLFGRDVEGIYGRSEFLRIYLSLIVLCGVAWVGVQEALSLTGHDAATAGVLGASGAVLGIMVLYCTHFPHRVFLIYGILPVPAWLLCVFYVLYDLVGFRNSLAGGGDHVAYEVHLAGAIWALIYRHNGWNLGRLWPNQWQLKWRKPSVPNLKIHEPQLDDQSLRRRVDDILAKISTSGEGSLTKEERRVLEDASRRYQQRRS